MYALILAAAKVDIDVINATAMTVLTSTIMQQYCGTCGSQGTCCQPWRPWPSTTRSAEAPITARSARSPTMGCWSSVSGGDVPRLAMRTQLRQCHTRGSQSRRVASAEATARTVPLCLVVLVASDLVTRGLAQRTRADVR